MKAVYVFLLLILSILLGSPSQSNASTIYHIEIPFDLTYQEVLNLLPPGDQVAYENEVYNFYTGLLKPYYWDIAGASRYPGSSTELRVSEYITPWSPTVVTGDLTPVEQFFSTFFGLISHNTPSEYGWFIYSDPPPVPIPGAIYLLGSGFIILIGFRRKLKG